MDDAYIQTKQRELNAKLQETENKQKLLDHKTSAMERQIERYQTVLDDIKKQSNEKKELLEEIKQFVGVSVDDKQKHLQRQIDKIVGANKGNNRIVEDAISAFDNKINLLFKGTYNHISTLELSYTIFLDFLCRKKKLLSRNETNFLASLQGMMLERLENNRKFLVRDYEYREDIKYVVNDYVANNSRKYGKFLRK